MKSVWPAADYREEASYQAAKAEPGVAEAEAGGADRRARPDNTVELAVPVAS